MTDITGASFTVGRAGWGADLWHRMQRLFWLKASGVTLWTWAFFIGYFELLRARGEVLVMPLTALDGWIAFQPAALPLYLSLWLYVGIAPGLLLRLRELLVYGAWAGALCLTGLALFWLWPTATPPLHADGSGHAGFALLRGVDAPGNACPSMHVAASIFAALWIARLLHEIGVPGWMQALNGLWFVLIAWSTLAVKQHVALDVLAGAALGAAFAAPSIMGRMRALARRRPQMAPLSSTRREVLR